MLHGAAGRKEWLLGELFIRWHKYGNMKTTLNIRDDLYRKAKARAALRGTSLGRFLEESLTGDVGMILDTNAIAALVRQHDLSLLSLDGRFDRVKRLRRIAW